MRIFGDIQKADKQDDGSVIISGIASSEALDAQGEIVSADAMRKALPDWMAWGNIREQHTKNAVGKAIAAEVSPEGKTKLTARVVDSEAVKKVLAGVYKGFSIAGETLSKMDKVVTRLALHEISICDRPVNPECVFSIWKAETPIKLMLDSKFIAKALGMPDATEEQLAKAFAERLAAAPAAVDLAPLTEKIARLEKASNPSEVATALEKLTKSVEKIQADSTAGNRAFEKSEKQKLVAQASAEGKEVPFTDEQIYGTDTKPAEVSIDLLKSAIGRLQKSVNLKSSRNIRPVDETEKANLKKAMTDPAARAALIQEARDRATDSLSKHFEAIRSDSN